jgi:AcrR family transcriptional regulator
VSEPALSRRERNRRDTVSEIKERALNQIALGGLTALSLNAIAKEMGMSAAALYRYFDSRDDLIVELVIEAYRDLADTMEAAAEASRRRPAAARFRAVTDGYRHWAIEQPHRYRLAFLSSVGSGLLDPARIIPATQRSMAVILDLLTALHVGGDSNVVPASLDAQLQAWHRRSGAPALSSSVLYRGIVCWTRLHGVLSLELEGQLGATTIDPALIYRAEVEALMDEESSPVVSKA